VKKRWLKAVFVGYLSTVATIASPQPVGTAKVHGRVQYEKLSTDSGTLDISHPFLVPAAGVTIEMVEIVPNGDNRVLVSDAADENGDFAFNVSLQGKLAVKLRALAENGNTQVVDVDTGKEYAVATDEFSIQPQDNILRNVTATDHATPNDRGSGPFNIVAVISKANALLHTIAPGMQIPRVIVRWSTTYVGDTYFDGTTNPPQAFINGKRDEDSDEFDDSVIIHEYGHFIAAKFSRDDSPGGSHALGEKKDPRLAWSEGWANFFSSLVRDNPKYVDTLGLNGTRSLKFSLDVDVWGTETPGIWSEHSVGSTLWDIFAHPPIAGPPVHLGLGFNPIWQVFTGALRGDRYVSLLSFSGDFCALQLANCTNLANVLARHDILYNPAQTPPVANPYPRQLQSGKAETDTLDSSSRQVNKLESQDVFTFSEVTDSKVKMSLTVTGSPTPAHSAMGIYLFDDSGKQLGSSVSGGVNQVAEMEDVLKKGRYFVEIRSWAQSGASNFNRGQYSLTFSDFVIQAASH
jgi:hypothetical protein